MFDTVLVADEISLPHFPEKLDKSDIWWQTKSIGRPDGSTYRITTDGRLERKESDYREKTDEEKAAEAEEYGFDSWEEMSEWADEKRDSGEATDVIEKFDDMLAPRKHTLEEEYWVDHNMHGSFEFHGSFHKVEDAPDFFFSYEARFDRGDLEDVVLLGERGGSGPEEFIEKIDEWTKTVKYQSNE